MTGSAEAEAGSGPYFLPVDTLADHADGRAASLWDRGNSPANRCSKKSGAIRLAKASEPSM